MRVLAAFLLMATSFAALALPASAAVFYSIEETAHWSQHFVPWDSNREFFQPSRKQNPTRLYVCAGHGRTGTSTMATIFRNIGITADHASGKVSRLIPVAFFPKENPSGVINEFSALLPNDSPPRALVDIPTGFFTWDLLDAFPNSTVSLAVRTADSWCDSYFRFWRSYYRQGAFGAPSDVLLLTSPQKTAPRQMIRRFFELNAGIIAACYQRSSLCTVLDFTADNVDTSLARFLERPADSITVPHLHKLANSTHSSALAEAHTPASNSDVLPYISAAPMNPQQLNLLQYMTPMASLLPGIPFSKYLFVEKRKTLSHPLIIGAGFDGTGLSALQRALAILGKTRTAFPAFGDVSCKDVDKVVDGELYKCANRTMIKAVMQHGFQNDSYPASMWANTDAVMGHPVPLFVWDFLEAFPKAKVILTVRQADALWDTVSQLSSSTLSKLADQWFRFFMKPMLWGVQLFPPTTVDKRLLLRRYWAHNAKVIHGVPRAQLLVWDIHADPSWAPLCDFLGVPIPSTPFPAPSVNEF